MRGRHALHWYAARLMPAVEDTEEPLGYDCFSISRGIKGICKERVSGKINVWVPCEKHKKWKLSQGSSIHFFLLHFKSPESLVYFYRSLVRSRRGTVPGRWRSLWCICGITARAALFWASVLWPGTSELECSTEAKFIFDIAWKLYPCTFLMHLSDHF